jgi:hypothetical protein
MAHGTTRRQIAVVPTTVAPPIRTTERKSRQSCCSVATFRSGSSRSIKYEFLRVGEDARVRSNEVDDRSPRENRFP